MKGMQNKIVFTLQMQKSNSALLILSFSQNWSKAFKFDKLWEQGALLLCRHLAS